MASRASEPFKSINCSALGNDLLESRLFGYMKGAFTNAMKDTIGIIESAGGGTVFLDEIGDISMYMQQALLRVLQEKMILPVGATEEKPVDVRFICATNRDLSERCRKGEFRWDLYYRLTVAELHLPSLLERGKTELEMYLDFFVKTKSSLFKKKPLKIEKNARKILLNYPFPGNLRELENLIERLYVHCDNGIVNERDLPERIRKPSAGNSLRWEDAERELIIRALQWNKGNVDATARDMGYARNTLIDRFGKYKISPDSYKSL